MPQRPSAQVTCARQTPSGPIPPNPCSLDSWTKWSWWQGLRLCGGSPPGTSLHQGWPGCHHCCQPPSPRAEATGDTLPGSQQTHCLPHTARQLSHHAAFDQGTPFIGKEGGQWIPWSHHTPPNRSSWPQRTAEQPTAGSLGYRLTDNAWVRYIRHPWRGCLPVARDVGQNG